jgi:hypothetical protein
VKRIIIMALGVLLALALATPMALAQVGKGAAKSGTAAELAAAWTQWAYSQHAAESPLIGGGDAYSEAKCDGTPVGPTQGKTWFLAGTDGNTTSGTEETVRNCTMPVGTHLFFPVVSASFFITFPPQENEVVAQEYVDNFMKGLEADSTKIIDGTVDGKEIKSNRIVRADTPFFPVTFPQDNIFARFGVTAGTYPTVTNGLWVTLPPLPPGEHTIHFEIRAPNADTDPNTPGIEGFFQNNTYKLTVVNKGKKPAP